MWADQPTQSLPALICQTTSHLSSGFERGQPVSHHRLTRTQEQDHANPPLGRVHTTLAVAMPKTPWKPRITLTAEVGNLLNWGMTEDYDHEPEHSAMAKEPGTKVDTSPPQKAEVPVWPFDTSSQVSVAETEGSIESNPVCDSPIAVAYSSCRDSPTMDPPELQADAHLAVNQMLSIKRSSDLKRHVGNSGL